jgi:hypothetical protein
MSVWELILYAAFAVFWVAEAVCHFVLHNARGSETISHQTRRIAHALTGRYAHLLLAVPPLLLFLDLEGIL